MGNKRSKLFHLPPEEEQTGILLWFQLLQNHWLILFYANFVTVASLIPAAYCLFLMVRTRDLVFWAAALVCLVLAGPCITALNRVCVRIVQRLPVWLGVDYKNAWVRDWKQSMLLTALLGSFWSVLAYGIYLVFLVDGGLSVGHLLLFAVLAYILTGMTVFGYQQVAMLELPFILVLKNALLLIFAGRLRSVLAVVTMVVMALVCILSYRLAVYILLLGWLSLAVMTSNMIFGPVFRRLFLQEKNHEEETV